MTRCGWQASTLIEHGWHGVLRSIQSEDSALELVAQQLPAYMVPSRLIEIDRVPLNANGKIDRSALRARLEKEES